ncbi:MAG: M20 family metallopeptidase [Pyramidobacter sp.]|nr:M20 family metallopeptidase [Pyramidobacter sp.]
MYTKAQSISPWLSSIYHSLHQIPELDRNLPLTTAFVRQCLDEMHIPYRPCAGGLLAELPASRASAPVVLLRADMDALPVTEATELPFASQHDGCMHACGHDAHMTAALGALHLLREESVRPAALRVMFQPAEETTGGAAAMIEEGALDGVSEALCLHVAPSVPCGCISVCAEHARAASNMFNVTLRGKGSHGAYPHTGRDVISAGAQIIAALQTIVSRETDPLDSAVVTIGKFTAGTARNVIPEEARFEGILRTLTPLSREHACSRIREIAQSVAHALRVDAEVEIISGYPALINAPRVSAKVLDTAARVLGAHSALAASAPQMGVDDFAYVCQRVPSCYADLGCALSGAAPLHSPHFCLDESCLPAGAAVIAAWALEQL